MLMGLIGYVALAALVVSTVALTNTLRVERRRHATSVSIFEELATGEITDENHARIVIRNDGSNSVILQSAGMAYGRLWTNDRTKPERWAIASTPIQLEDLLLEPGKKLRLDAPESTSNEGMVGPIAVFMDANGRTWQKTRTRTVQVKSEERRPRRRDAWFGRQKWFERVEPQITSKAMAISAKHPNWLPLLPWAIDLVWGWRPGPPVRGMQPFNAPQGWAYLVVGAKTPWIDP